MALDDGNNFQSEQGVSQNRNIHNVAIKYFMKATETSRAKAKSSRRTMQILQECRSLFFKQWGISNRNNKMNIVSLDEDNNEDDKFNFDDNEVVLFFLLWCCFAILSVTIISSPFLARVVLMEFVNCLSNKHECI